MLSAYFLGARIFRNIYFMGSNLSKSTSFYIWLRWSISYLNSNDNFLFLNFVARKPECCLLLEGLIDLDPIAINLIFIAIINKLSADIGKYKSLILFLLPLNFNIIQSHRKHHILGRLSDSFDILKHLSARENYIFINKEYCLI